MKSTLTMFLIVLWGALVNGCAEPDVTTGKGPRGGVDPWDGPAPLAEVLAESRQPLIIGTDDRKAPQCFSNATGIPSLADSHVRIVAGDLIRECTGIALLV